MPCEGCTLFILEHISRRRLNAWLANGIEAWVEEDYGAPPGLLSPSIAVNEFAGFRVSGTSEWPVAGPAGVFTWITTGTSETTCVPPASFVSAGRDYGPTWPTAVELPPFPWIPIQLLPTQWLTLASSTGFTGSFAAAGSIKTPWWPAMRIPAQVCRAGFGFHLHWLQHPEWNVRHLVDTWAGQPRRRKHARSCLFNKDKLAGIAVRRPQRRPCSARVFVSRHLKLHSKDSTDSDASPDFPADRKVRRQDKSRGLDHLH
jgi:hypothetical protein